MSTRGQRAGRITPTAGDTAQRPAAEATFGQGEQGQVTAEATTVGLPGLRAKTIIEIRGVGRKCSGLYYVESVRHRIDGSGYRCELALRRNAVGRIAGAPAPAARGTRNEQHAPPTDNAPAASPATHITIDANSGRRLP
jgi:hypothetical protein